MSRMFFSWIVLFLAVGCSPNSLGDFQHEGEALSRSLILELEKIEDREQLVRAEPHLKKRFEALIGLMIEARAYQQAHPEDLSLESEMSDGVENELKEQLRRIYGIEGGREVIERAQQEALVRLDASERTLAKKKGKVPSI